MRNSRRFIFVPIIVIGIFLFEGFSGHLIDKTIDSLFLIKIDKNFDKTILGELCLKIGNSERIYIMRYILDEKNQTYINKSLTGLVDIATWKEEESDDKIFLFMKIKTMFTSFIIKKIYL